MGMVIVGTSIFRGCSNRGIYGALMAFNPLQRPKQLTMTGCTGLQESDLGDTKLKKETTMIGKITIMGRMIITTSEDMPGEIHLNGQRIGMPHHVHCTLILITIHMLVGLQEAPFERTGCYSNPTSDKGPSGSIKGH